MYGDVEYVDSGNYFINHWRGNHSLALSYWINAGLICTVISTIVIATAQSFFVKMTSLQSMSIMAVFLIIFSLILTIWGLVGVWRSARYSPDRGGSEFWATAAKVMVTLSTVGIMLQMVGLSRTVVEYTNLAIGHDPLGDSATLHVEGNTLSLSGTLTLGVADAFEEILNANSQVTKISLISRGGRVHEARRMSELIHSKGLKTQIDGACESACTMLYLAGKEKILSSDASVGFHSPSLPGVTDEEIRQSGSHMRDAYVRANLPADFINKALETPSTQMWYPNLRELASVNAVDRVTPELVVLDNIESAKDLDRQAPIYVDEVTILHSVKADGPRLTYRFSLNPRVAQGANGRFFAKLKEANSKEICSDEAVKLFVKSGATFKYVYADISGRVLGSFHVNSCDEI